jgi:hypothetical protein
MKTPLAVLVGLFSFGSASLALAQLSPDPAPPVESTSGVAPVVDTADYVQISALPFAYRSVEREVKTGTVTNKTDSSGSVFGSVSPTLYFKGGVDRLVLRALLSESESPLALPLGRLHVGFRLTDLLEIGGYLAGARVNTELDGGSSSTTSFFYFGPYARLAMDLGSRLSLESEIRLGLGTGKSETETVVGGTTSTVTVDRGGFELAVNGAIVRNLTSNLDYTAMLEIALNTYKEEPGMTEDKRTITSITLIPLGLRYRF